MLRRISGVLALVAAAGVLAVAPAQAITGGSQAAEGTYSFVAKVNTTGRDCTGALVAPQWVLTASTCFGAAQAGPPPSPADAAGQQWTLPGDGTVRTAAGACADIGRNAPGTPVITVGCVAGNLSQQWFLKGDGTLRNHNSLCADLGSNDPGSRVITAACVAGNPSQRWRLDR
ncbi:ricin-type beta-trefoil lectin domain protein [Amycolatopsis sp. NPDC051061]|uniref:RICIN domain-containing protein n=1 Tax=Amycolatopsis sp. NPDC051061 TaxID=3155042 RepID=UPI0034335EFE